MNALASSSAMEAAIAGMLRLQPAPRDPLATLREIAADGPAPFPWMHYAGALTAAVRASLAEFADGAEIMTVGDGKYRIKVQVAGRDHWVTVEPVPMRITPVEVAA